MGELFGYDPDSVNIDPTGMFGFEEIVEAAMSLLQRNLDLVRWSACLSSSLMSRPNDVPVPADWVDCLLAYFDGTTPLTVQVMTHVDGNSFFALGNIFPHTVNVSPRSVENYLRWWDQGGCAGKFCVAARLASTFVHEAGHLCGVGHTGYTGNVAGNCLASYSVSATLQWAFAQRYPCIAGADVEENCDCFACPPRFLSDIPVCDISDCDLRPYDGEIDILGRVPDHLVDIDHDDAWFWERHPVVTDRLPEEP